MDGLPDALRAMNAIDLYFLKLLNNFAHRSSIFDGSISFLSDQALLKGGLLTCTLASLVPARPKPEAASRVGHFNTCRDNDAKQEASDRSGRRSSSISVRDKMDIAANFRDVLRYSNEKIDAFSEIGITDIYDDL